MTCKAWPSATSKYRVQACYVTRQSERRSYNASNDTLPNLLIPFSTLVCSLAIVLKLDLGGHGRGFERCSCIWSVCLNLYRHCMDGVLGLFTTILFSESGVRRLEGGEHGPAALNILEIRSRPTSVGSWAWRMTEHHHNTQWRGCGPISLLHQCHFFIPMPIVP